MEHYRIAAFQACAWGARLILLALVAVMPWVYGGAQWQAQFWLVLASLVLAVLTLIACIASPRRVGSGTRLTYWMLALMVVAAVQIVPLPDALARRLGAGRRFVQDIAAAIATDASQSGSQLKDQVANATISIHSQRSAASLAVLATATIALWSSSVLLSGRPWAIALTGVLAVSGLANAFLGLIQRVSWNGWSLLEMPTLNYFATFVNRNSAPPFFAISTGAVLIILGIAYRDQKRKRRREYRVTYPGASLLARVRNRMEDIFIDLNTLSVVCICAVAFMLVASLATYSRGGALSLIAACLTTLCLALGARGGAARAGLSALAIGAAVIAMMTFFEFDDTLLSRFDQVNQAAYEQEDGRLLVWKYTLHGLGAYAWLGSGLGTYQFAILPFHSGPPAVWFQHAENLPLELWTELGIAGLACASVMVWWVLRSIYRESAEDREGLMFVGTTFAVIAVLLQSLVDFSLILPGIFLPLAAMVGSYSGRVRRMESEQARQEELGEAAGDARLSHAQAAELQQAHQRRMRTRVLSHTVVAAISILMCLQGMPALQGFAAAERLEERLDRLEKEAYRLAHEQNEDVPDTDIDAFKTQMAATLARFPGHAEVQLIVGRGKFLLWHLHSIEAIEWGDSFDRQQRWKWAAPYTLVALKHSTDEGLKELRSALDMDALGREYARACLDHFMFAWSRCPLDARALWGLAIAGVGHLNADDQRMAAEMVLRLCRNNPRVLSKAGLSALSTGREDTGRRLITQAIALDAPRLWECLPTLVERLSVEQILLMLPGDVVLQAKVARNTASMPGSGPELSAELTQRLLPDLGSVAASDIDGWMALSWVAKQGEDLPLKIQTLRRSLVAGVDDVAVRLQLAQFLWSAGKTLEAWEELKRCKARDPSNEEVKQTEEKWLASVDRNP